MGDTDGEAVEPERTKRGVHHRKDLDVCARAVDTDYVKIALEEFPVAAFLGVLAPPDLRDVETFERKGKFSEM